jgi:uncharacterized protein (DUF2147 family)
MAGQAETTPFRSRIMRYPAIVVSSFALLAISASPSLADPSGIWLRENGNARVRIAKCGDAFCGTLVWVKDPDGPSKVGQRVFYDMKSSGENAWSGRAFNPEDGRTYAGKLTLSGSTMTTSGCALGGMICRSFNWRKVN